MEEFDRAEVDVDEAIDGNPSIFTLVHPNLVGTIKGVGSIGSNVLSVCTTATRRRSPPAPNPNKPFIRGEPFSCAISSNFTFKSIASEESPSVADNNRLRSGNE